MGIIEPFKYDETALQKLMKEFQIPEIAARKCLKKAKNNVQEAIEHYFNESYKDVEIEPIQPAAKTAKTEPAAMTEDEQLKLAMEMSKQTANERPLALPGPTPMSIDGDTHISAEEAEMNRVVLESLQAAQYSHGTMTDLSLSMPDNPTLRVRDPNLPVGLKNVGNTCYFNSLLQTYNNLLPLRNRVLAFPTDLKLPAAAPPRAEHTLAFMKELQKLFALMEFGNQKYVDPSPLLKKLMDRSGTKPVELGQQEDVSEFNDLVLERITEGLALVEESQKIELIKHIFMGKQTTVIAAAESDGTPVEVKTENDFSSLILPIGEDLSDFHTSLEAEFSTHVEYTTPKTQNRFAAAEKVTWLDVIPPVLMFQENRVEYSKELKQHVKRNEPLLFDKDIYMDRYMSQNKEEITKRRKFVNELRVRLAAIRAQIKPYDHFPGKNNSKGAGLIDGLEIAREILLARQQAAASEEIAVALKTLNGIIVEEVTKVTELRKQEADLRSQIESAYSDLRQWPYTLFGVWLHQGAPGVGHYWSYMRHPRLGKWLKYNDLRVSEVDEATVMKEATGGYQSITASFLIYIRKEMFENFQKAEPQAISPTLQKEIEQSNAAFQDLLQKYQASKDGPKLDRLAKAFQTRRDELNKQASDINSTAELLAPKIPSFGVFLRVVGQSRYSDALILVEIFKTIFEGPIESAHEGDLKRAAEKLSVILDPSFKPAQTVIDLTGASAQVQTIPGTPTSSTSPSPGERLVRDAVNCALDGDADLKALRAEFDLWIEATQYLQKGLELVATKQFYAALPFLQYAMEADNRLRFEPLKRASSALPFISLAIHSELAAVRAHRLAGHKEHAKELITHTWTLGIAAAHFLQERNSVAEEARTELQQLAAVLPENVRPLLAWERARVTPFQIPFTAIVKSNQLPTAEEFDTMNKSIISSASRIRAESGSFWSVYRP